MKVSDEELAQRREKWVPREPKVKSVRFSCLSCSAAVSARLHADVSKLLRALCTSTSSWSAMRLTALSPMRSQLLHKRALPFWCSIVCERHPRS